MLMCWVIRVSVSMGMVNLPAFWPMCYRRCTWNLARLVPVVSAEKRPYFGQPPICFFYDIWTAPFGQMRRPGPKRGLPEG